MVNFIDANNKTYEIGLHALKQMRKRGITDDMITRIMETGTLIIQMHGPDKYEGEFEQADDFLILQVVVDESKRFIVTVVDITEED